MSFVPPPLPESFTKDLESFLLQLVDAIDIASKTQISTAMVDFGPVATTEAQVTIADLRVNPAVKIIASVNLLDVRVVATLGEKSITFSLVSESPRSGPVAVNYILGN